MYKFKKLTLLGLMCLFCVFISKAQIITTFPSPVQEDSHDIVITFHADQGNKGLAGLGPNDAVYAHTGVITNESASPTDWKYAPQWLDNNEKYRLKYTDTNTWELTIPDIRTYYGITNPDVTVSKLMFVFRNANGSKEGKTATGGDIAVNVLQEGLQVSLKSNASPFGICVPSDGTIELTATATNSADIAISINGKTIANGKNISSLKQSFSAPSGSRNMVVATASSGEAFATDTLYVVALSSTKEKTYPQKELRQGIIDVGDSYIFTLAAPGKKNAVLVSSWNDFSIDPALQMNSTDVKVELPADTTKMKNAYMLSQPYFWISVPKSVAGNDFTYFYILDGITAVSDPYATLILDPDNDKYISESTFRGLPEYPITPNDIRLPLAWHTDRYSSTKADVGFKPASNDRMIIYEILLRDFTASENGTLASGNLSTAMHKLDYIASLGVDAIELMPIMEFGGNNSWGYNPNFYFAPDKAYGTPDDYRQFIAKAHELGMAVILDVVFNQSDSSHPWWNMYSPADNPFYNASAPHSYSVLNDWNQDNPLVEQQWIDMLSYWMAEYGADGFRFDLVKGLGDNGSYGTPYNKSTNTFGPPSESATNQYNKSRVERMVRLHNAIRKIKDDVIFINEDLATPKEENDLALNGDMNWANINNASCQFAMGYQTGSNMNRFYAPSDGNRSFGSTVSYAESHDEERMAYKQKQWALAIVKDNEEVCMRRLGSVAAQMLMTPGAHMIWQFQELGDSQPVKLSDGNNNTAPRRVVWDLLDNPYHLALKETYASLIDIRNKMPQLFGADAKVEIHCGQNDWTQGRSIYLSNTIDGSALLLKVNPTIDNNITINVPDNMIVAQTSYGINNTSGRTIMLPPGAFVIMTTEPSLGIETIPVSEAKARELYDLNGRKVDNTKVSPGYYIMIDTKATARKVLIK